MSIFEKCFVGHSKSTKHIVGTRQEGVWLKYLLCLFTLLVLQGGYARATSIKSRLSAFYALSSGLWDVEVEGAELSRIGSDKEKLSEVISMYVRQFFAQRLKRAQ
jgi:hypothetical protein